MGINKVQYGNTTLIDLTSDTVTADKLMQGYTAHDRSGALITGTATGGGSVTQDQDGYIVLPSDGGGGGGASNCVTGTFTTGNGGNAETITVPYTGNGYPVFLTICLSEGVCNNSGTVYNTIHQSGILMVSSVKYNTVTPDYTGSGQNNYSTSLFRYKSTSTVGSISGTTSNSGKYIEDTPKSDSASTTMYIDSATTFSIYVSPSSGTYGFIPNTEYTYAVMYSE